MNKSKYFSGQQVVSQPIKYLNGEEINRRAKKEGGDRYYKKFHTYDHLVTMLMTVISDVTHYGRFQGFFWPFRGVSAILA